ncbi:MAG: hypothetical protein ABSH33_12535 [Steroidobacteraceae bacterium]|jgi:hypothetical protein
MADEFNNWGNPVPLHPADAQRTPEAGWQTPVNTPFVPTLMPPASMPPPSYIPNSQRLPAAELPGVIARGIKGDFLLNVIFVGVLWEVWVCLYPLAALAGLYTFVLALPFLRRALPDSPIIGPGLYAVILAPVAALIVLWSVSRLEHVFARNLLFRVIRHGVRLLLLAALTLLVIQKTQGHPYDPSLAEAYRILGSPQNLTIVVAVVIGSHFALWNWRFAREFWHRRLESARLRKPSASVSRAAIDLTRYAGRANGH